ncbi:MAG: hypothetical protein K8T90_01880 [Planctomycetes bacterium]|nr:hypothetical protein [Planctomycetota bacterium]
MGASGRKWPLFALGLLGMLVLFAGLLACGVGVFFSAVILQMAQVFTYLRLSGQHCAHLDRA